VTGERHVNTGDLITILENASPLVVLVALLVFEIVVPKSRLEDMKAERDEMKAERDEWKRVAELNGARADAGVLAAQAARDVFAALHEVRESPAKELE
jgi:regulator of protease activity HflC (stomatin/prohibitin superfamily)